MATNVMSKELLPPPQWNFAVVFALWLMLSSCSGGPDKQITATSSPNSPVDDSAPILVKEGYLGQFNILRYQGKHYALAQDEGPFLIDKIQKGQYRRAYSGSSMEDVARQITEALAGPEVKDASPILVQQGYKNDLNIIRYRGTFYALAQDEGAFDFQKVRRNEYKRLFSGQSLDELKRKIP
jgi:hypothetical protein